MNSTFSPNLIAQLRQIQSKLNAHTIGTSKPTDSANNDPVWTKGTTR